VIQLNMICDVGKSTITQALLTGGILTQH